MLQQNETKSAKNEFFASLRVKLPTRNPKVRDLVELLDGVRDDIDGHCGLVDVDQNMIIIGLEFVLFCAWPC